MTDIYTTEHPYTALSAVEAEQAAPPKGFTLSSSQDLGIKTNKLRVTDIRLAPDDSGDWFIEIDLLPRKGVRNNEPTVSVRESHQISCIVKVSRQEIADFQGIPIEDVRTTLTLDQTETIITTISLSKLLPVFNLTL